MKVGILGPVAGIIIGCLLLWLTVHHTVTDSNWRWLGFAAAVAVFLASIKVAVRGEKKRLTK